MEMRERRGSRGGERERGREREGEGECREEEGQRREARVEGEPRERREGIVGGQWRGEEYLGLLSRRGRQEAG